MLNNPIQDRYDPFVSACYGCGNDNTFGHKIKTNWTGSQGITRFIPKPFHTAIPGFVYGGLIASLFDCHSTGTASAYVTQLLNPHDPTITAVRFVTASLKVDYLKPTPLGPELVLSGEIKAHVDRKVTVMSTMIVNGIVTAKAEVIVVEMPESFLKNG